MRLLLPQATQASRHVEGREEIPGADGGSDATGLPCSDHVVDGTVAKQMQHSQLDDGQRLADLHLPIFPRIQAQSRRHFPERQRVNRRAIGHGARHHCSAETHTDGADVPVALTQPAQGVDHALDHLRKGLRTGTLTVAIKIDQHNSQMVVNQRIDQSPGVKCFITARSMRNQHGSLRAAARDDVERRHRAMAGRQVESEDPTVCILTGTKSLPRVESAATDGGQRELREQCGQQATEPGAPACCGQAPDHRQQRKRQPVTPGQTAQADEVEQRIQQRDQS